MTEHNYHERVHRLLLRAYDNCRDSQQKSEYLSAAADAHMRMKQSAAKQTIVFGVSYDYVTIGEKTFPHPGKSGIDYAHFIFMHGVGGRSYLHATEFVRSPGDRPGNTLRTAMNDAAKWVEYEAGCPLLAVSMRRPILSITDLGEIIYNPERSLANIRLLV